MDKVIRVEMNIRFVRVALLAELNGVLIARRGWLG
jgi:hypothetical protein